MPFNKLSPQDFIQQTFAPMIAVMTSPGVEESCKKNNLSFTELIKPFSLTTIEGQIKDLSGNLVPYKNMRISFCDINSRPPPDQVARNCLDQAISCNVIDRTKEIAVGDCVLDIPLTVPWYEAWRHAFLQVIYPSHHEFVKHYIGCMVVISSEDSSPMEYISEMKDKICAQMLHGNAKPPKWFGPPNFILFTYLLLHDNTLSETAKSESIFEAMKTTYDPSKCFILSINSRKQTENVSNLPDPWVQFISTIISYKEDSKQPDVEQAVEAAQEPGETTTLSTSVIVHPLSPVTDDGVSITDNTDSNTASKGAMSQHGMCLTSDDINRIKQFVNDFFAKALIPHFQHHIQLLNEQVLNKKGVSRSLLSATKRWFGTAKPGAPGNHISPTAIAYSSDSHELQLRRLGDLCFMIGHYQLAYNAYHSAKRDFNGDGAWLHYAGALEMAALSAFMANTDSLARKVIDYFEESITTYQNVCRLNQFATRATIMSVECLRGRGLYGEAAKQLIRMAGEDSDLRSAVLLEQAAYCFLSSMRPIMYRKYAFHMVLAGNRFAKASHKNHSMRCYHQAYQVYSSKGWMIAEDHILHTIGKHASHLKMLKNAFNALSLLVTRSSPQLPHQQQLFFKDYISNLQNLWCNGTAMILNLPVIENHLTQIYLSVPDDDDMPNDKRIIGSNTTKEICSRWLSLEEQLVNYTLKTNVMVFKPVIEVLTAKSSDSVSPSAVRGEPIGIYMCFYNPLHIDVKILSIQLTWKFTLENGKIGTSENCCYASSKMSLLVKLQPESTKYELLKVIPNETGCLEITGIAYVLGDVVSNLSVPGSQPFTTLKKVPPKPDYVDHRLKINIIDKAPHLKVHFIGIKTEVFCNEIFPVTVKLQNTGALSISRILLISSPNCTIWVKDCKENANLSIFDLILNEKLNYNESFEICVLIKPSHKSGTRNLELLFYYESGLPDIKPRYRLVKKTWPILVVDAFRLTAITSESNTASEQYALNVRLQIDSQSVTSKSLKMQIESVSILSSKWELGKWVIDPSGTMENDQMLFILLQALRKKNPSKEGTISTNYLLPDAATDVPYIHFLPKGDIVCVVNWKLESSSEEGSTFAKGQEHIFFNKPESTSQSLSLINPNMFPLFRDLSKPLESTKLVSCRIHLPQRVRHQFLSKRLCTIPVVLHLHNCSEHNLAVKVSASFSKMPKSHSICFSWVGQTSFTKSIEGLGDTGISLVAAVTTTGAYDFSSGLIVEVKVVNEYIKQSCNFDSITVIY